MSNHLDYEINKELGECYLFMGEFDKAEEYYQKAANSNGIHPDPYLGLATIAVQRGESENALTLYKKAASIEETDKALAGMGLVHMDKGNHEEAFMLFSKALSLNPQNMIALTGILQEGYALEKVLEVIPHLTNFIALDADNDAVRFSLAGCYISIGQTEESREHLEVLLKKNPENEAALELFHTLAE